MNKYNYSFSKKFFGKYSIVLLIIAFGFLFPGNADAQRKKERDAGVRGLDVTRVDFFLPMNDGILLDCTKFFPDTPPPPGGWPALIYCHGYGASKDEDLPDARELAGFGYFTIVYSMRGQGISEGESNLISTLEMSDFMKVAEYTKSQSIVKSSRVGAIGGSQGGTIPLMAASNGTNLRCIVSDVTNPNFATSWMYNNSVKMTLLWSVSYTPGIVRYNSQVKAYRNWILDDTPDKFDSLSFYMPLNRDFMGQIGQNITPTLVSTVWQDKFFNTKPFIDAIPLMNFSNRMYFGTFDAHGADYYEAEDDYHDFVSSEWLDYWLDDVQNGVTDSVRFMYASSTYPREDDAWTWKRSYSNVWPPAGTENVKFYLWPDGRMRTVPSTAKPDTIGFVNDVVDPNLTMLEAVNREFTGAIFDSKFRKTEIVFETPPLAQETKMVGTPFINVHYRSNFTKAQFNYQIYEIKPGTEPYIVGRANYTERNITPNIIRQLSFYGTSCSHIFSAGSRIRVVLTNLDNIADDPFLRTNPYVLPSLDRARNTIYMNPANPTYVQLPLIDYIPNAVNPVSSGIPAGYNLAQNYPNPFNPVTNIRFELPEASMTKLTVYDALGREAVVLVNEQLNAGVYEAKWTAGKFPSGVYFYRLETAKFSEIKKMVLVK